MLKTKLRQLRESNRDLKNAIFLEHEDRYLLNHMFAYLWHKNLNAYDTECLRQDLLGMAQEARQRKQTLREVIGDSRALCDDLAATCNKNRPLSNVCAGISFCCCVFFILCLFIMFCHPQTMLYITADILLGILVLELAYYLLWFRVIPLPYALYNHRIKILILACFTWSLLYGALEYYSQTYREMVFDKVLLSLPFPVGLVFVAALILGYVGFAYVSETLAYRQSSFRK